MGYRATRLDAPKDDLLLPALGGDAALRNAVYEATVAFSNSTVCNWTEKLDVHLPVARTREEDANWEYLDVSTDAAGRIWIEEAGERRDRSEYWLSLASLALVGAPLGNSVFDEQDCAFVKGSDVASWFFPPDRREGKYSQAMKAVSFRLQEALRKVARWWLMDERNLANNELGNAMLVFSALPIRAGRTGATVIPDALGSIQYGRPARGFLARLRQRMEDLYLDLPAERFHPKLAQSVLTSVEKQPETLKRLVAEQGSVMETMFQLSEGARECRDLLRLNHQTAMKAAAKLAPKIARDLHVKMRRFAFEVPSSRSAPMVLVAASCGMAEYAEVASTRNHRYLLTERKPAA